MATAASLNRDPPKYAGANRVAQVHSVSLPHSQNRDGSGTQHKQGEITHRTDRFMRSLNHMG